MRQLLLCCLLLLAPLAAADEPDAKAALKAEAKQVRRLLRKAANARDVKPLELELRAFSDAGAVPVLFDAVRARKAPERRLAIRELARRKAPGAGLALARAAVEDKKQAVRGEALTCLQQLPADVTQDLPTYFTRVAESPRAPASRRIYAVQALGAFPAIPAIPSMIRLLRTTGSGGKGYFMNVKQRAYVGDVEVDTTGPIPVLNPKISKVTTGSVLEIKIILVWRDALIHTLSKVTGQRKLGTDPKAWEQWWRGAEKGFRLPR